MTAATVFMWIFTIILLISVLVLSLGTLGGALGWFGKRKGPTWAYGTAPTVPFSKPVAIGSSATALISLVICIIIGATSSKQKEGFVAAMF